ncbi:MAG TPA: sigma-70 family RNA polymerase sigma factor [Acidimicrobiales bacterium]|nr:sigma-70 family RNA polymerase sigma factor [Acidimicrobiales bacterium]
MIDLETASDASLVVAIARWNEAALAEVYRRHGGAVQALARRLLGSDAHAEDITQEVFVRLWEQPERFDHARGGLRSFLLSVAHHRAVDQIRSSAARSSREERDAAEVATSGYDIERHAWDLHLTDQVRRALVDLSDDQRRAIELAYFGGHTYRQVAAILDQPEGTVKARIRTGLINLRRALEREGIQL